MTTQASLSLIQKEDLSRRPGVHAIRLDEIDFRILGLQVSLMTLLQDELPVLRYDLPQLADYAQILRCPQSALISGGRDLLHEVARYGSSAEEMTAIYQRNDFWEAAVKSSGCELLTPSHSESYFVDSSIGRGSYIYHLRACVDSKRLVAGDSFSTANCSRQLASSPPLDYQANRRRQRRSAFRKISEYRSQIDSIVRSLSYETADLADALHACQEKNKGKALVSSEQKENMRTIVGLSAGGGGLAAGALLGGLAMRGQSKSKIGGAAMIGGVTLGAVGYGVGEISQAIDETLNYESRGIPADDPSCYQRDKDESLRSQKKSSWSDLCSCAEVGMHEERIRRHQQTMISLQRKHDALLESESVSGQQQKNQKKQGEEAARAASQ